MSAPMTFFRPETWDQAWNFWDANPDARIVAGGTDLVVKWKNGGMKELKGLLDLGLLGLDRIEVSGEKLRIGSGCTMSRIAENPDVKKFCPVLADAVKQVGALQIRNLATLGGNVANASQAGDSIPALFALEAVVLLRNRGGERRVPIAEFFTGPGKSVLAKGECIIAFELPLRLTRGVFFKLGERRAHAISKISLAVACWKDKDHQVWRIACGAVAPTVIHCRQAEHELEKMPGIPSEALIQSVSDIASRETRPIDDLRSTRAYRQNMVGVLVQRALKALSAPL